MTRFHSSLLSFLSTLLSCLPFTAIHIRRSLVSPRTDLEQFTNLAISPNYWPFLILLCRILVVLCKCSNIFWIFYEMASLRSRRDRSPAEIFRIGAIQFSELNRRSAKNGEETLFLRGARAAPGGFVQWVCPMYATIKNNRKTRSSLETLKRPKIQHTICKTRRQSEKFWCFFLAITVSSKTLIQTLIMESFRF